jgi:phosphohistidine swiveling domain-containing protein
MRHLILPLDQVRADQLPACGGKAVSLGRMVRHGFRIPPGICLTTACYDAYLDGTGLRGRILLEIGRKEFGEMRWEELWDAALRIRNMFGTTPLPPSLHDELAAGIRERFREKSVVVRSSSVAEDSSGASFAGIHESFVNVSGTEEILDHVRRVWASLWSDAALLYRRELGLDTRSSAMGVVVQEIVAGDASGILFGKNPQNESEAVIEAVYGLNQGLVDGAVEPDRWILDRRTGRILAHRPAHRESAFFPGPRGVIREHLAPETAEMPPLSGDEIARLYQMATAAEELFGSPQDMEWTKTGREITILQSRPVTAGAEEPDDGRRRYLGLKMSFTRLKHLREAIEGHWLPAMEDAGRQLAAPDPAGMPDPALGDEILRRLRIAHRWHDIYWEYFIPFAHGVRLFGIVYNDTMHPDDPYEFVDLLAGRRLISLERNRELAEMAAEVRRDPALLPGLAGSDPANPLTGRLRSFIIRYGSGLGEEAEVRGGLVTLLRSMAAAPAETAAADRIPESEMLRERFLSRFGGDDRAYAAELLDLARRSYALRDNDNHALDAIEAQADRAANEGRRRLAGRGIAHGAEIPPEEVAKALRDPAYRPRRTPESGQPAGEPGTRARQIVGQPASRGSACGAARVIRKKSDLFTIRAGEILVCDAIEPGMTVAVPLAAGIVERRGGMLIHGAIIAREYGIPCVTGIPRATDEIATGEEVCVDGYLGIVTVRRPMEQRREEP